MATCTCKVCGAIDYPCACDDPDKVRAVSAEALVLATDVDDMMGILRNVASLEYTREEVRTQAHAALERLKRRGV
jgi:hypothetical protein